MQFDLSSSLLGRPEVRTDLASLRPLLSGKRVFITGAGGSIGSHLAARIAELAPAHLTLLDQSEFNLYTLGQQSALWQRNWSLRDILCDIRDVRALDHWFTVEKPDIVIHAAALKHVNLGESQPLEYIRTNVLGTKIVADLCRRHAVKKMVVISTDKVVNAHSVMGATKKIAERYCQALDAEGGPTRFTCVRFGNVLDSAGSVVPLFRNQIRMGGPLTVTHHEASRYFMTAKEATDLVLEGLLWSTETGSPRGCIYVLNMGEPLRITDLAQRLIETSGRDSEGIRIEFIGLKSGEKLTEELIDGACETREAEKGAISRITGAITPLPILQEQMAEIAGAIEDFDQDRALAILGRAVPAFGHHRAVS